MPMKTGEVVLPASWTRPNAHPSISVSLPNGERLTVPVPKEAVAGKTVQFAYDDTENEWVETMVVPDEDESSKMKASKESLYTTDESPVPCKLI